MNFDRSPNAWTIRRRLIYATLTFCAVCIAYLVFKAPSDPLRETLATVLAGTAATILTGYILGATLDDRWTREDHRRRSEHPPEG